MGDFGQDSNPSQRRQIANTLLNSLHVLGEKESASFIEVDHDARQVFQEEMRAQEWLLTKFKFIKDNSLG